MRFVADHMLGKLARWLRFMGHDTLYPSTMDDDMLMKMSADKKRILLTRDKDLATRCENSVLIESDELEEQIKELINKIDLSLETDEFMMRCPICNSLLHDVASADEDVPKDVKERFDSIWKCKECGKHYWQGSHYERIVYKIKKMKMMKNFE